MRADESMSYDSNLLLGLLWPRLTSLAGACLQKFNKKKKRNQKKIEDVPEGISLPQNRPYFGKKRLGNGWT
jgi:hypothetical protein